MTIAAAYGVWLEEVQEALASINMPIEEWQRQWAFDFQREFQSSAEATDAAMKANRSGGTSKTRPSTKTARSPRTAGYHADTRAAASP